MRPVEFDGMNIMFKSSNQDVGDLPAFIDNKANATWTCWQLSEEDLDNVMDSKMIWVHFAGYMIPPVGLSSVSPFMDIATCHSPIKDLLLGGKVRSNKCGLTNNFIVVECDSDEYEYIVKANYKGENIEEIISNTNTFFIISDMGLIVARKSKNEKTTSLTFEGR